MATVSRFKIWGVVSDASILCPSCAIERYGPEVLDPQNNLRDNEGSELYHLYIWEVDESDSCDRCLSLLVSPN